MISMGRIVRVLCAATLVVSSAAVIGCEREEEEREARASSAPASKTAAAPVSLERGRELYKLNCTPCHGEQGKGDGPAAAGFNPKPRNHADAAYMNKLTDEEIAKVIQYGGAIKGMPLMPSNPVLKGADLAAVVAYTRSLSTHDSAAR